MNCDLVHERIVAAAYGELGDEETHELERHLSACEPCRQEQEQIRALKVLADAFPMIEPEANLVARSRLRLEEALDALPPKRWWERLSQRLMNNVASLQAAPIAACLLLVAGGGAGVLGGYEYAQVRAVRLATRPQAAPVAEAAAVPMQISNVSSVVRQPGSDMVEVRYNQVIPQQMRGSLDDPKIRQLLMVASEDPASASLRDDSVGMLADECRAGHSCQPAGIRDALMLALRYDRNAGVRAKAMQGLAPYVSQDVQVRDAVLEALMNDADPRVRTQAIEMLEPVGADMSVRQVLSNVATSDQSAQIRNVSRQVLRRGTTIQ